MARSTLDVADAVASEIKDPVGVVWTQDNFVCESTLLPLWTQEDLAELHLSVLGIEADSERHTRSHVKDMHKILVGVQKAVDAKPADYRTQVRAIVAFLFEMKEYFLRDGRRLATIPELFCTKAKVHVLYNPDALESENVYEGLLELTFGEFASG